MTGGQKEEVEREEEEEAEEAEAEGKEGGVVLLKIWNLSRGLAPLR